MNRLCFAINQVVDNLCFVFDLYLRNGSLVAWSWPIWPPFPSQCLQANTSTWCKRGGRQGRHLVARVWLRSSCFKCDFLTTMACNLFTSSKSVTSIEAHLNALELCCKVLATHAKSSGVRVCKWWHGMQLAVQVKKRPRSKVLSHNQNAFRFEKSHKTSSLPTVCWRYWCSRCDWFSRQMPLVSCPQSLRHYPAHPLPSEGSLVIVDVLPDLSGTWRGWTCFWKCQVLRMFQTYPDLWNFAQACLPPWKHYWPVRCVWCVTCWGITGRREKDKRENMLKFLSMRQWRMNKNSVWSTDIQRMRAHGVCSESWTWADWTSTADTVGMSLLICSCGDFLAARQSKMHGSQCFVRCIRFIHAPVM